MILVSAKPTVAASMAAIKEQQETELLYKSWCGDAWPFLQVPVELTHCRSVKARANITDQRATA